MLIDVSETAPPEWGLYVSGHPLATAYHRAQVVEIGRQVFGLRTYFLTCREDESRLVGVLPLVEQSSIMFGRYLVSVPFFTYGGILADSDAVACKLADQASRLGQMRSVDHVELRHSAPIEGLALPARNHKISMALDLPDTEDALAKSLGSKLRSQIRRADREQPEISWGGAELIPDFYRVFSSTMHQLGTPVYPRSFFTAALQAFGELASTIVVRINGAPSAAAIIVRHCGSIEVPWAAATPEAKGCALNMRMYWEMLASAVREGVKRFDFGRCTEGSGTHRFKAQWGAKAHTLHWYYWLARGREMPELNHANPKYAVAAALWRRMPLWCANLLGPRIARYLP